MAIRKFIEEIGEKVLPTRRNNFREDESAEAIRHYLSLREDFTAPPDLVVVYNEVNDVVIIGGTIRDERTRERIVEAAGNIRGVERVDDRMVLMVRSTPRG